MKPKKTTISDVAEVWRGDMMDVLDDDRFDAVFDAVITDPPYSSGGAFRGDRVQKTVAKYVQTQSAETHRGEFAGDNRDQRAFTWWCSMWATACRTATKPGGVLAAFIDWRQIGALIDAIQAGGWVYRGLGTWHKPGIRMIAGRFSSSAEYVVYATNGPAEIPGEKAVQNVFSCAPVAGEDKEHIAEKPVKVGEWLVGLAPKGGRILDPFAGSGALGVAAIRSGRTWVGIEQDKAIHAGCVERLRAEESRYALFEQAKFAESP